MRFIRTIAAALLPLALSGCAEFKGRPSLGMDLPETFQQQPTAQTPIKLQKDWWKHTKDKTLLTIIQALETQNLLLEQARFRLNAARMHTRKFDFLPSLAAKTEAQYDRLIEGNSTVENDVSAQSDGKKTSGYYNAKLDASWEIPIYGQLSDAADIANANIAFAKADIEAIRASVISEAIRLYADMRRLQQESSRREVILKSAQQIVEYQNIKHKAGLIVYSELSASYQSLLTARNEMQEAESSTVARMHQLAKLLGSARPYEVWKTTADIPSFDVPALDDTPLDVLRNRPDIRKAEASVFAAAGEFELSKSEMYPKITLSGNISQLGNLIGTPLMGTTVQLTGIPSLSLPLFDWGKRLSAAQSKDEKLSEKASIYRDTVVGAMNEVEEFWSSYRTAQAVEKSAEVNAQIAYKVRDHANLLFKQGLSDGIAATTSEIDAARAAITELKARADTITRLTTLTKALGGASAPAANEKSDD